MNNFKIKDKNLITNEVRYLYSMTKASMPLVFADTEPNIRKSVFMATKKAYVDSDEKCMVEYKKRVFSVFGAFIDLDKAYIPYMQPTIDNYNIFGAGKRTAASTMYKILSENISSSEKAIISLEKVSKNGEHDTFIKKIKDMVLLKKNTIKKTEQYIKNMTYEDLVVVNRHVNAATDKVVLDANDIAGHIDCSYIDEFSDMLAPRRHSLEYIVSHQEDVINKKAYMAPSIRISKDKIKRHDIRAVLQDANVDALVLKSLCMLLSVSKNDVDYMKSMIGVHT